MTTFTHIVRPGNTKQSMCGQTVTDEPMYESVPLRIRPGAVHAPCHSCLKSIKTSIDQILEATGGK